MCLLRSFPWRRSSKLRALATSLPLLRWIGRLTADCTSRSFALRRIFSPTTAARTSSARCSIYPIWDQRSRTRAGCRARMRCERSRFAAQHDLQLSGFADGASPVPCACDTQSASAAVVVRLDSALLLCAQLHLSLLSWVVALLLIVRVVVVVQSGVRAQIVLAIYLGENDAMPSMTLNGAALVDFAGCGFLLPLLRLVACNLGCAVTWWRGCVLLGCCCIT